MPKLLTLLAVALLAGQTPAADPGYTIRWFGLSMFQLETPTGKLVVFDPHLAPDFPRALVKADVVCISHLHSDHTQLDAVENAKAARVFSGLIPGKRGRPAEWAKIDEKVGAMRVRTVGLYHDTEGGLSRGRNSAFVIEFPDLKVCHLGDLGHDLTPEQVKAIGPIDVLMVPVGGVYTLNGSGAKRAVAALKPSRLVLPMHYGVPGFDDLATAEEFLDGTPNVARTPGTNAVVVPAAPPPGGPVTAVLGFGKK